ncbi:hypothetical protein [Bradyrhizobium japonicum]|uniref:hypothetical protein n=1 Tax=Bradyrhizobium japonicum TaxID=375 RepID=UPI001BA87C4E|nr:hypothetical protein [Bradyrhizobium japonicum]MBR0962212.1 hypothetical protein [Bradyrhizobium japonicum]
MAFEKLETIIRSGRAGLPASIMLHGGSKSGRPAFIVNLSKEFAAQAAIGDGDKYDLLIGTDEEAGVIRLAPNATGLIAAQFNGKGGARFFCGHIERFGSEPREKEYCAAELVDDETGSIEITLPPWALA